MAAARSTCRYLWHRMRRQKLVCEMDVHTHLSRCLSTLQLTAIGVGSTVGVGIYVLLGVAIRDYAGPGVIVSFLVAGFITLLIALIFAEFGSYIPHTGGSYTYVYFAVGELPAFVVGWLQMITSTSSGAIGARAWSGLVDSLFNNSIQNFLDARVGQLDLGPPFSRSLDWVALIFVVVVTLVVSCNVHCSSIINSALAVLTVGVLVFVTIAGIILGDLANFTNADHGGFLPYGIQGVVVGASSCFYATSGCDSICLAAEESKNPSKAVPRAILLTIAIVTVVYCGAAAGTLCLIPHYAIDLRAPIPSAFAYQGVTWARYLATIGPLLAVTNLNILSLFSVSRIAYRMACDGLFFKKFAYVQKRTKIPLVGVVVFGCLYAVTALLLELKDLVQFTVLCMLSQYFVLAPGLIALRTRGHDEKAGMQVSNTGDEQSTNDENPSHSEKEAGNGLAGDEALITDQVGATNLVTISRQEPDQLKPSADCDGDLGSGSLGLDSSAVDRFSEDFLLQSEEFQWPDSVQNVSHESNGDSGEGADDTSAKARFKHEKTRDKHRATQIERLRDSELRVAGIDKKKAGQTSSDSVLQNFCALMSTNLTIFLLMVCVTALALQFTIGWQDLKSGSWVAVLATSVLICLIIFFCEVLHPRCGPGLHDGFRVPLVPYIPTLSCFLSLLLFVSAADVMGLAEVLVLMSLGLAAYICMALMQKTGNGDGAESSEALEQHALLTYDGNDSEEDF